MAKKTESIPTLCPHCGQRVEVILSKRQMQLLAEEELERQAATADWERVNALALRVGYPGKPFPADNAGTFETRIRTWMCSQGIRLDAGPEHNLVTAGRR